MLFLSNHEAMMALVNCVQRNAFDNAGFGEAKAAYKKEKGDA